MVVYDSIYICICICKSNGRAGRSPKRFTERRSMAHKLLDTETRAALNKNGGSSGHATPMQLIKLMT